MSPDTQPIAAAARRVLSDNRQSGTSGWDGKRYDFVCPSGTTYPFQWLWDSAFHSIARSHVDPELAQQELRSIPGPNVALVDLRFARGAIGNVETIHGARYGYDIRAEIVGTEGTLLIGGHHKTALQLLTASGAHRDLAGDWLDRFGDAYLLEMRGFVRATLDRRPPYVTADDGRRALAIALAADNAGERGTEVAVG